MTHKKSVKETVNAQHESHPTKIQKTHQANQRCPTNITTFQTYTIHQILHNGPDKICTKWEHVCMSRPTHYHTRPAGQVTQKALQHQQMKICLFFLVFPFYRALFHPACSDGQVMQKHHQQTVQYAHTHMHTQTHTHISTLVMMHHDKRTNITSLSLSLPLALSH